MRVLVTRPAEDAHALVAALDRRGHEALVEPMLTVAPADDMDSPLDLDGVQALLFTSANGVRAFAALSEDRILPVFAVGEASAAAARAAGFGVVESAEGDVTDLARLVDERLDPNAGALFHGAGSKVAGDLKGDLETGGFTVHRVVLYHARPVEALSDSLRTALADGRLDAVTLFSPRTAETFATLLGEADLLSACERLAAVCLSDAVAERVSALPWRDVRIAERPNQDAVLTCLDDIATVEAVPTMEPEPTRDTAAPDIEESETSADPARQIIAAFGGIRPMASKLGIATSTVQGWRERGTIPSGRHDQIAAAAASHGIEIDEAALAESGHGTEVRPRPSVVATEPVAPTREPPEVAATAHTESDPSELASMNMTPDPPRVDLPPRTPHVESAPPARNMGPWLGGMALGAAILGVGVIASALLRDPPPQVNVETVAALEAIERRLAALETAPAAADPADLADARASLTTLADDLAEATERLEALEGRLAWAETDTPIPENLDALTDKVEVLEDGALSLGDRIAAMETWVQDLGSPEQRAEDLSALDLLGDRLDETTSELAARGDRLAALEGRVEALAGSQAADRATAATGAQLALGVLQLRDALRGAGPFQAEFEMLHGMATAPASEGGALGDLIAPLSAHAATGVPSLTVLQGEFPAVARQIVIQAQGGEGDGWVAGMVRRLSALVSVRPSGSVAGDSTGAVVARAEAHLAAGDLSSAVGELDALSGAAAAAAGPWRAKAEARLTADRVLTELGQVLTARAGG